MESSDHDDLVGFVLKVTYGGLVADAAQFSAATPTLRPRAAPERFSTRVGLESTRRDIVALCHAHGADEGLSAYLSTHWLERFAPVMS